MKTKQRLQLTLVIVMMLTFLLAITFGDKGLADLNLKENEKQRLVEENASLARENLVLYRRIQRLKHDPKFIENVARQELGMIGKDEVIFTFKEGGKKKAANAAKSRM